MKNKFFGIFITILFSVNISFSQKEHCYCINFFKETLKNYDNPDTLIIIDNPIAYTLFNKQLLSEIGRNIIYLFKTNGEWHSAYSMITYENEKMLWYQTVNRDFDNYNSKKSLESLFDNCFNDIQKLIEEKPRRNSGGFIYIYIRQGKKAFDIMYCPPVTGDIVGLLSTQYKSFYDAYSLGLAHSITMHYPYTKKCINYKSLEKDSIQILIDSGKIMD